MEGDVALLRSQNRQLTSLQAAFEREVVVHRQREVSLNTESAQKDTEIGALRACVERAQLDKQSLQSELEAEREAKGLLSEEIKLLRTSAAMLEADKLRKQVPAGRCIDVIGGVELH